LAGKLIMLCFLLALISFPVSLYADTTDSDDDSPDVEEEINTNDPTAAAISVSAGWEINDWYEDEIAPGQTRIDQLKTAFEVDNWVWAASLGVPVKKTQSIKLTWLSGRTQNLAGRDSDNLLLSWSMRWVNR